MLISTAQALQLLLQYKYFIIFPIAVIEGPVINIICGFLASTGHLEFWFVYIILVVADMVGDVLFYLAGFWGGNKFIEKWGRFLRINEDQVLKMENGFVRHGGKILLTGKLTQVAGGPILVAAGVVKYNFSLFFWYNLIGTVIKSFLLLLAGYYAGYAYERAFVYFDYIGFISSVVFVLIILGVFYYLRKPSQKL